MKKREEKNNPVKSSHAAIHRTHTFGVGATSNEVKVLHKLPADLRKVIAADKLVRTLWKDITPLARNEWICWVISAKKDETRGRRIAVGRDKMRKGMRRPCCWAGCPHR